MSYVHHFHQKEPINPNSFKGCRGYSNSFHKDAFKELCRFQYQDMGQLLDCTPVFCPHAGQNATSPSSLSGSLLMRFFFWSWDNCAVTVWLSCLILDFCPNRREESLLEPAVISVSASPVRVSHPIHDNSQGFHGNLLSRFHKRVLRVLGDLAR